MCRRRRRRGAFRYVQGGVEGEKRMVEVEEEGG